ncbi:MAG: hypothetical protein ACK4MD_04920 [Demequina sp.]
MPSHASSRQPQNRVAVVACLIAAAIMGMSQLSVFERHVAWFWGAALLLLVGALWAALRSPSTVRQR